jgi:hypothetical protein
MDVYSKVGLLVDFHQTFLTFLGTFDAERIKQGNGTFIWMKTGEEDETPVEKARYEGNYKDGNKCGVGKMVYPNGDIYEGEWLDNKVTLSLCLSRVQLLTCSRCMEKAHISTINPAISTVGLGLLT